MPTTTASPLRSSRMPDSFAPAMTTSFGHFSRAVPDGVRKTPTASWRATAAVSASVAGGGSLARRRTSVDPEKLPGGALHVRPSRPRPAVCRSARSHSPSSAPCVARRSISAFVDPVSEMKRMVKRLGTMRERRPSSSHRAAGWRDSRAATRRRPSARSGRPRRGCYPSRTPVPVRRSTSS